MARGSFPAPASSPRRHCRRGCCSSHDPAATTGPNDACAVGKGALRNRAIDLLVAKSASLVGEVGARGVDDPLCEFNTESDAQF
jgi:hypothetical protein